MELIYVALIGIAIGVVKGYSGFGSSIVGIPLFSLVYGPDYIVQIVLIMIVVNIILNAILMVDNKAYQLSSIKKYWLIPFFGVLFSFIGTKILLTVNGEVVSLVAAGLIIIAIVNKVFQFHISPKDTPLTRIIVGSLSGLGNGIASIDGPPVVAYLTSINAPKKEFKSLLSIHFLITGIAVSLMHFFEGSFSTDLLIIMGVLIVFTIIGLLFGMFLSGKSNEKVFQNIILIIMVGLTITLIVKAL